jgi:Fe-Mn family superoxide dismutase
MSPDGGEGDGELREALESAVGSVEDFKARLEAAGAGQFGSD